MTDERQDLIALVERLMAGNYAREEDLDRDAAEFEAKVPHPRALGLIYYWDEEFGHEPSADEVVDRALSYRGLEL